MDSAALHQKQIADSGFTVINDVFSANEIEAISKLLVSADNTSSNFRKTDDLFAIRQLFKAVPGLQQLVFNPNVKAIARDLFGDDYFVAKAIYFDKPGNSNWFVAYHQDLTISADKKVDIEGFSNWTIKNGQFAVQPPLNILEDNFTIRIHLDDTNVNNGALKIIPASHKKGIYRANEIDTNNEIVCEVPAGGIMIMKPLLMHASSRTLNDKNRRVIHVEFSRTELPEGVDWAEKLQAL